MAAINELQLAKELIKFPTVTPIDAGIMKFLEKKLKILGFKIIFLSILFLDLLRHHLCYELGFKLIDIKNRVYNVTYIFF